MSEEGATARRRKRRRRRGSGGGGAAAVPSMPAGSAKVGEPITIELPVRFHEILAWAARASGLSHEQMIVQMLRGVLSGMKPAWREAVTGVGGDTAARGAALDRLLERKRPGGV
jgi:hypothetical protein